ncbi:MAG: DUF1127 domain-containing protein [Alphaproteobacteria bacterium]
MQLHTPQSLARVHGLDAARPERSLTASMIGAVFAACGWIGRALRFWHDKRKAMQDYRRLLALPDYMLRDIGVSRDMVRAAMADEPSFWRR